METGKDKIQRICDTLRKETLDPAKQEAREIVENAHLQAAEIVKNAEKKAAEKIGAAAAEMEEKKKIFHASLNMACRQGIEQLKQRIEKELLNQELVEFVAKEMKDQKLIAHLLTRFIEVLEEKGIEGELVAAIPKDVSARAINELLGAKIVNKLKNHSVQVGDFAGGVQISLKGKQITIDVTDAAVRDLIAQYIRRDFRNMIFTL